jgi:ribonuclease HI
MNKLIINTDGGARGNPGPGAIGVVIKGENGKILSQISRTIGKSTNNIAEYSAVVAALEWLRNNMQISKYANKQIIQFYLDSVLVANQLNGLFKIKNGGLRNLLMKIRILEQQIGGNIIYTAIPREQNWQADALVNEALDEKFQITNSKNQTTSKFK